jgi:hypothetical protein
MKQILILKGSVLDLGGRDRKVDVQAQPRQKLQTLPKKQMKSKKGWRCGSKGRELA